jgi:hypothetical protein
MKGNGNTIREGSRIADAVIYILAGFVVLITLYPMVGVWNSWFSALVYLPAWTGSHYSSS